MRLATLALLLLAAMPASAETVRLKGGLLDGGYTEIAVSASCYDDLRAAAEAAQEFVQDPDVVRYEGKILTYTAPCRACDLRAEAERVERLKDVARRLREVIQRCPR